MTVTQNYNEKIERFKIEFESDPLYQKLIQMELEDRLFAPCVLYERVFFDTTYSTKQAAELLEKKGKEQTLINFLNRNDFDSYIEIHRQGERGFYRYDYRTLFQFKMIFLLTELGQSPLDIASLIGLRSEYENPGIKRYSNNTNKSGNQLMSNNETSIQQIVQNLQEDYNDKVSKILQYVQQSNQKLHEENQRILLEQKEKDLLKEIKIWEVASTSLVARIADMDLALEVQKASHLFSANKKEELTFLGIKVKKKEAPEEQKKLQAIVEEKIKAIEERKAALLLEKEERDKQKDDLYKQLSEIREEIKAFEQKHLESTSPERGSISNTEGDPNGKNQNN